MRLCAYPYRKQGKNHPKLDLIREENDLQDRFLHMMYSHAAGRAAMQPLVQSFVSRAAGCFIGAAGCTVCKEKSYFTEGMYRKAVYLVQ